MSRTIQLRNVTDALYRKLKARAVSDGMLLSEYLLAEVRRAAERPTVGELRRRLAERPTVKLRVSPAQAVREERDGR